jgi:hypothetical protein
VLRRILLALCGLLILFHVWLFCSQLWEGRLGDTGLVVRWVVAAGLGVAFTVLWRRGTSLFWGRKAVAVWLLAALLHGPALTGDRGESTPALPEAVTALVQIAMAAVALGIGLAFIAAFAHRRRHREFTSLLHTCRQHAVLITCGRVLHLSPRPPPFSMCF